MAGVNAQFFFRIIGEFPGIECDVRQIFETLTHGQGDVQCLFKLEHPKCVESFDDILIEALLYGPEVKGEQR